MSLLTLERSSPSPHESENEDLLSTSSYEGFVARDNYALCLTPRPITSLGPGRRGDHMRIFSHLKKLVKLLRPADKLKLAVELENTMPRKVTKYMVVIVTHSNQDTDETIVIGTEQEKSNIRIGLVLPLWRDTEIKLDGDGGFSVHTGDRQHVFKPLSVQSMWTALQTLYKCTEHARLNNHYVGGFSHTWMSHYATRLTTDGSILNEWNLSEDVESFRPDSPIYTGDISNRTEETQAFEKILSHKLRQIMLEQDLEETTCKQLRLLLEDEVEMDLKEYKEFLDRQMLRILGQMERPSQIYDYLFLGSEWNASNLSELKELGVKYILNITKEIDNFYPEEFKYLNIRLYDVPGSELIKHWDKTYKFIKEAKLSGKKVLVHCKMGISRSAATVVAYTMKEYNMSLVEALKHVRGIRSVVNPNEGFMQQLKDYEGILRARHNELWGKKAPSRLRLHPLEMSRKLFHSEPNLPDYQELHLAAAEPELSFLPEEGPDDGKLRSLFPPNSSVPIDKHENIRTFLASLPPPPVVTVDDDQGMGGDIPYTSESGSGFSTPNLSPTDDEQFNLRYQKMLSKKNRASSMLAALACAEKGGAVPDETIKSEGEVTCNVNTQDPVQTITEQPAIELESCDIDSKSCDIEKRESVAAIPQIPFTIKTIEVESVSVPGSVEPSSLSPNPSSNVSSSSQPLAFDEEESGELNQAVFRLGSEESDIGMSSPHEATETAQSPQIQTQETTGTVQSPQIQTQEATGTVQIQTQEATGTVQSPQIQTQEATGTVQIQTQEATGTVQIQTQEATGTVQIQTQEATGTVQSPQIQTQEATGTVQSPQIQSVPERVKEIEKLNSKSESNLASLGKLESSKVAVSVTMSSNSSVHSQLSSYDQELAQLEEATPPSLPHIVPTRHESLSPSPPSKRATEHVRHASLCTLPSAHPPQPELSTKCDSEDMLGSSLRGAVRARVLNIEEKKGHDPTVGPKQSCASEKSDTEANPSSSAELNSEQQSSESAAVDEPNGIDSTSNSDGPQKDTIAMVTSHVVERTKRESTPPAVSLAWSSWISTEDVPPPPVQDLKRRFEDSKETTKVGGALRRTQSLRTMNKPQRVAGRASTSSPEKGAGPCSEDDER